MEQTRRVAWNSLVALSSALSLILLLAWAGNYQHFVRIRINNRDTISLGGSEIKFDRWDTNGINWSEHAWRQLNRISLAYLLVQDNYTLDTPKPIGHLIVIVPYWWSIPPFTILPSLFLWRRLRRRRIAGSCANCGYDLRATQDRCPECGTVPAKK